MNAEEIALVRTSWADMASISDQAADMFYGRLFEAYPEVRPLFKGELDEQGEKLMRMIGKAVDALDDLEPLDRVIKMMGARHSGYGVDDGDYEKLADALFWTLEKQLGDAFTPATRAAWVSVYDDLATMMREGGKL
ncbi:MAG: globin family protein [Thiohalocapsa sp.]|jgi:hemoglobin-like flavoprotein